MASPQNTVPSIPDRLPIALLANLSVEDRCRRGRPCRGVAHCAGAAAQFCSVCAMLLRRTALSVPNDVSQVSTNGIKRGSAELKRTTASRRAGHRVAVR